MATALISDLIAAFRETYKDVSDARVLAIAQEADEEIMSHVPMRKALVTLAAIVAGTQGGEQNEYPLDEKVLKIWSVRWYTSATDFTDLEETHIDELDVTETGWRRALGTPTHFYTNHDGVQGLIGFYPNPDTATSAGFPCAKLDTTTRVVLATGTALVLTPQIRRLYVNCMRMIHAMDRHLADVPMYTKLFNDDLAQQSQLTMTRAGRVQPRIQQVVQRSNWRNRGIRVR